MVPYVESVLAAGGRLSHVTRHMLGLFHGRPGARQWRRILTVDAARPDAGADVLVQGAGGVGRAGYRHGSARAGSGIARAGRQGVSTSRSPEMA